MTEEAAQLRLNSLRPKSEFSIDEAIEGFQVALALGDQAQAARFRNIYLDLMYSLFLDIALNITKQEYLDLFMQHTETWDVLFYESFQFIYLAIIFKQKDQIADFPILLKFLEKTPYRIYSTEKAGHISKSIDELTAMFLDAVASYKTSKIHGCLVQYAQLTDDIAVAEKILAEIPTESGWLRDDINFRIVELLAEEDFDAAVEVLQAVQNEDPLERAKYFLAKKASKDNPDCADALISSINPAYFYGLDAHVASENRDETAIRSIIDFIDSELEHELISTEVYDAGILNIGFAIVGNYPLTAFDLTAKLHESWADLCDLKASVAEALFVKGDFEQGLEYFDKIDDEIRQYLALLDIISQINDPQALQLLTSKADQLNDAKYTYDVYRKISQKTPVTFDKMYALASNVMPYDTPVEEDLQAVYEECFFASVTD